MNNSSFFHSVICIILLVLSSAFAKPSNDLLKIGVTQEFENLNPLIRQMSTTFYVGDMVGRRLTVVDPKGAWIPQLAETLPTIENGLAKIVTVKGKDGKTKKKVVAQWTIRSSASWGDGTPVTGKDVLFSWKIAQAPTVSVGDKEVYGQVEKIEIDPKNPKKMTFTYKEARWDFNHLGTFEIVPQHIEEPIFKKFGGETNGYDKNSAYVNTPTNPGLYCGPYIVSEIKLGSHIILKPNKHFYGNQPKIKQIVIKLIPNTGTLESNLRSGSIDMISHIGFTLDQAIAFDKKVKKEKLPFVPNFRQGLVYEHIDLQLSNDILKDINVRKALVYAIDRDKLTQALFDGKQKKAIHNINPIDTWYTDDPKKIVLYKTSVRKAKKMLSKAGWKLNKKDGFRYKNGKKLSFQFMTTSANKLRELVQVYLQNEWKKVGVEITIKNEPPRVYFGETITKSKFPAMAMYAWTSSPENVPRSQFHSTSIPTAKNGYSGQNVPRWVNKEVDKIIEALEVEFNAEKRKELAAKMLYHYTNEVPVIPLYYRSQISVTPKGMKGYYLTGHQFASGNHVEDWSF